MLRIRLSILLLAGLVVLAGGLGGSAPAGPRTVLAQGSSDAWVPITVLYTSDVKGHIEPCG